MNTSLCNWVNTLRWFRLHTLWFDGGEITFDRDVDEGIVHIGVDVLVVIHRDRQYWIPFDALTEVRGVCRPSPNQRAAITLRSVVSGWVDEEPPIPDDDTPTLFWHSFILRSGRQVSGVVVRVSDMGVQVRTAERETLSVPWRNIGAAVELLE